MNKNKKKLWDQGLKHCRGCVRNLAFDCFSWDQSRGDGLNSRCRKCISAKNRARVEVCTDCGGPRSYSSGRRCSACYKTRAVGRKEFAFFHWRFYYDKKAITLLSNDAKPWPEVKPELLLLAERKALDLKIDRKQDSWDGMGLFFHKGHPLEWMDRPLHDKHGVEFGSAGDRIAAEYE